MGPFTTTAESNQLENLPLSALSADDSGPLQVTYGIEQPLATSTPRATLTSIPETQTTDPYSQIIPGMSEHLYPTLVANGSLSTPVVDNHSTLQNQITSEIDKYLQEVAERCERNDNYMDGRHMATNISSPQQEANFLEQDEEDPQMAEKQDVDDPDMVVYTPDESEEEPFNTAIDDTSDDPTIVMGKLVTTTFISDGVHVPTEKVGFLQVTSKFQEFLNHFLSESKEKAFEQIHQILQMLDAYLIDNPQQHQYCMSPDSEYISVIMYTTQLETNLCNFPAIWAVLSILLDT